MLEHGTLKRAPFFLSPTPSFVPHCKEPCAHVCGHPSSHIQAPSIPSAKAAPWPSSGLHTLTVQFTLRGTELWGRGPCKFRGHVGMLFQSFGDLKFVLEDMHSSVWLCVLGPVDSLCCGVPYDWGRARGLLRASGSSGWCQQLPVGGWDFISDEAKLRGPWCFQNPKLNVWL